MSPRARPARLVTDSERRARLGRRHCLVPEAATDDIPALTEALVCLHSSDPVSVYLSGVARMRHPSIEAIETALYDDRSVVRHHAMRRTLWVLTRDMAPAAHSAATIGIAAVERTRVLGMLAGAELGTEPEVWLDHASAAVLGYLREHGPSSARQVGDALPELRVRLDVATGTSSATSFGAHTRVLLQLGFEGQVLRARPPSWINGQYRYAVADEWIPGGLTGGGSTREARAVLADRWLHRFGPATSDDLRWWAGLSVRAVNDALTDIGAVPVALEDGTDAWTAADDLDVVDTADGWVAFLPALDPTTMGWKRRDWYVDPSFVPALLDRNGNAGPTIWVDGRAVGGWVQRASGEIAYELLADVPKRRQQQIARAARELEDLIGPTRFSVRFPSPILKRLLA